MIIGGGFSDNSSGTACVEGLRVLDTAVEQAAALT
jgi:hypothetical protein